MIYLRGPSADERLGFERLIRSLREPVLGSLQFGDDALRVASIADDAAAPPSMMLR
jgi:hypothetical protein